MTHPTPRRYFAASNSCLGFRNYYGDLFNDTSTSILYIVKGGPGTGKSHFMKVVARRAHALGYTVTEYACSSDPASLDGILMEKAGAPTIGMLDGTAPHVREPILPGVQEEIINLGRFWNRKHLTGQSHTIRLLGAEKSAAYDRAYAYLAGAGEVDRVADSLLVKCAQNHRLAALAARILRHEPKGERFLATPALRRAVSMTGEVCLHSFEAESAAMGGMLWNLEDYYGLAYYLTAALLAVSEERKHTVRVSYHPIYPHKIDGLFYPATGLCVLVGHAEPSESTETRSLSLRRYADPSDLRRVRGELRHARMLRQSLTDSALHELTSAATYHFELEKIYAAAMDFPAKEAFTESFCEGLFEQ